MLRAVIMTSLLALPYLALSWSGEDTTTTPRPCASSVKFDRPTLAAFHKFIIDMCTSLIPGDTKLEPPMHKTVSFEISQPNNQPSNHVLASVDITNWSPIDHLGCEDAFGAWGNGIEVTLDGQIEKGQICMKEGGKG
jgi:hypothetical protein